MLSCVKFHFNISLKYLFFLSSFFLVYSCGKKSDDNKLNNRQFSVIDHKFSSQAEKPFVDRVVYGTRPDDFTKDTTEESAITKHEIRINNKKIKYTATAGHLVTVEQFSSTPNAKMFYIAFTADNAKNRPVTFIYDGGPGTTSMFLMLGAFSPKIMKTSSPDYTPPAPYKLEDNPNSLLDKTDLVYINPVGSGYSTAIFPSKNRDFWGVDQDAQSMVDFITRYLSKNNRWNSPKYLMGLSYGTPRSAVLSFFLHKNGIDINGVTLVSSILDYSKWFSAEGLFPSLAAGAWYNKSTQGFENLTLTEYMEKMKEFTSNEYGPVISKWNKNFQKFNDFIAKNPNENLKARLKVVLASAKNYSEVVNILSNGTKEEVEFSVTLKEMLNNLTEMDSETAIKAQNYIGINSSVIKSQIQLIFNQQPFSDMFNYFCKNLLLDKNKYVSIYDTRMTRFSSDFINGIDYLYSDPLFLNLESAYTAGWFMYVNQELKYVSTSYFSSQNNFVADIWDYKHTSPNGTINKGQSDLYLGGDLAATINLNPDLKVFQASGYYDLITPFYQTILDINGLPLIPSLKKNIEIHNYPAGHLIFVDPFSLTKMKKDISNFYEASTHDKKAMETILNLQKNKVDFELLSTR